MLQALVVDFGHDGSTYLGLIERDTPVSSEELGAAYDAATAEHDRLTYLRSEQCIRECGADEFAQRFGKHAWSGQRQKGETDEQLQLRLGHLHTVAARMREWNSKHNQPVWTPNDERAFIAAQLGAVSVDYYEVVCDRG